MKKNIFCLLFIIASIGLSYRVKSQNGEPKMLEIGSNAPGFSLQGVDGKLYTLDDFKEYNLLTIIFTCNHCPTAQAYEDKIISIVNTYRPKGTGFVAISPNSPEALSLAEMGYSDLGDGFDDMKTRAHNKGFNFPYLYDGDSQKVSVSYGPVATPHVFVFDKERKLRYTGRIDDTENPYLKPKNEDLKNALDALLFGENVTVEVTKTFGCSVKWQWKDAWAKQLIADWAKETVTLEPVDSEGIKTLIQNENGKLRLINLWATWCGPCIIEFPELIKINRMYRGRDFELVTLSADQLSKKNKVLEFLVKNQASGVNLIYSEEDIYKLIELIDPDWQGALPYSLLIDSKGKMVYKIQGPFDPLILKMKIIEQLGRYYADDK